MTDPAPHPTGAPFKLEQVFFADPATDRLLAMLMTLAAELHVAKDRLATLEIVLENAGLLEPGALDAFQPDAGEKARLDAERQAFVRELMAQTLGREVSLGAPEDGVDRFNR